MGFTCTDIVDFLNKTCLDMEAAADQLQDLDAKAGDGDMGVTVKLGFSAVRTCLEKSEPDDIGVLLIQCGAAFNRAAASTFGTLMATAFVRAGKAVKDKRSVTRADMPAMLGSAIEGIMERGKASRGDCTMLDALIPAHEALVKRIEAGLPTSEAMSAAAEAAASGAESTAAMIAKHGRAGWLAEKSVGVPDAGATAVAILIQSIARHLA